MPRLAGASALTFYRGRLIPAFHDNLLLSADEGRQIFRIRFDDLDPTRIVTTEPILADQVAGVRVIAVSPEGTIYFCTAHAVIRLRPVPDL